MRIAMIGSRGLGSNYGGVERCLDALCPQLSNLGHEVDVYSAWGLREPHTGRMRNMPTPSVGGKHLSNLTRSAIATVKALSSSHYDVLHFHATGPGILSTVARVAGQGSVTTIHALDQKREKWGPAAQGALSLSEQVVMHAADQVTVVSESLRRYFAERYDQQVSYIPNGMAPAVLAGPGALLQRHGLEAGKYMLFAGRMTPEKGCHDLVEAFNHVDCGMRLAIAGGNGSQNYIAQLKAQADPARIAFLGHLEGRDLAEAFSCAHSFALPSYLEGMSLSLLEAIAHRLPLIVSDIPENRLVCAAAPLYFKPGDVQGIRNAISRVTQPSVAGSAGFRVSADSLPRWNQVAMQYLRVYERVLHMRHHRRLSYGSP